jgi:hypothetical protein
MLSLFHINKPSVKQPLRDFIIRLTNDSIKRQMECNSNSKETQHVAQIVSPFSPDNPKHPGNFLIPLVVGVLSVSSILYYFYRNKK